MRKRTHTPHQILMVCVLCVICGMHRVVRADDTKVPASRIAGPTSVMVKSLDGSTGMGTLHSLDADSLTFHVKGGADNRLMLPDVMWVARQSNEPMQEESLPLVMLTNDDVLCGVVTKVDEETLTLDWQITTPPTSVAIPLEYVRSIAFRQPREASTRGRVRRLWALLETKADRLISTDLTHVEGQLTGISENNVHLETPLGDVETPITELLAVNFNRELWTKPEPDGSYVLAMLRDGSRVTWDTLQLTDEGQLSGLTVWGTGLAVPVEHITQLQFLGNRIVSVADLEPSAYQFTPYFNEQHPLIRNRNVRGGPLRLRGTSYAAGLGVYSQATISYDLTNGGYEQFCAVIGVDDAAQGGGNVVFAVEVDGQRAYESPNLTGRSPATAIEPINVAGAKTLTLIVEFGEFANIGDVANWCNPVLIK